jgi:hypothetical protein
LLLLLLLLYHPALSHAGSIDQWGGTQQTAQHTKSEDEEEEEIDVTRDHAEEEEATADDLFDMIE